MSQRELRCHNKWSYTRLMAGVVYDITCNNGKDSGQETENNISCQLQLSVRTKIKLHQMRRVKGQ